MKTQYTRQKNTGERRRTKIRTTPTQSTPSPQTVSNDKTVNDASPLGASKVDYLLQIRSWIHENLARFRDYLWRLGLSKLDPGRARWGPPWQSLYKEDQGPPNSDGRRGNRATSNEERWHIAAYQQDIVQQSTDSASVRRQSRSYVGRRSKEVRHVSACWSRGLRAPRSEATRALCLLNRLRAHARNESEFEAINEQSSGASDNDKPQRLNSSNSVRVQRWVGQESIGSTSGLGRRSDYFSPALTPIREGGGTC